MIQGNGRSRSQLEVPDQDLKSLSFCGSNIKRLSGWIDNLSLFNLSESTSSLFQALSEIARLRVDEETRIAMLALLNPRIVNISHLLGKQYLNKPLILPPQAKESANLLQVIEAQAIQAYKVVIARLLENPKNKNSSKLLNLAFERSMYFLSQSLLRCYQLYVDVPGSLWSDINQIYIAAEQNKCLDTPITTDLYEGSQFSTVNTLYKQILCLTLSKPNQIRQKEIRILHNAYSKWSGWISLAKDANCAEIYAIDLCMNSPPQNIEYLDLSRIGSEQSIRYLITGKLVSKIRAHLDGNPRINVLNHADEHGIFDPHGVSIDVLSRLQVTLCQNLSRKHKRLEANEKVSLAYGYLNVHHFLSRQYSGSRASRGSKKNYDEGKFSSFDDENSDSAKNWRLFNAEVENVSESGYCLSFDFDKEFNIKPEELTSIYYERAQDWALGVVRWVEQFKSAGARAGIQLLSRHAYSCSVRPAAKTESSDFVQGFILLKNNMNDHGGAPIEHLVQIITPADNFQEKMNLDVYYRGQSFLVCSSKETYFSSGFKGFQVTSDQIKDLIELL